MIIRRTQQMPVHVRIPRQAITSYTRIHHSSLHHFKLIHKPVKCTELSAYKLAPKLALSRHSNTAVQLTMQESCIFKNPANSMHCTVTELGGSVV